MAKEVAKKPVEKEPYDHNDATPGVWVGGGHVISDKFGEMYGDGPMSDDELPIELQTVPIDYENQDIDFPEEEKKPTMPPPPARPKV